MESPDNSGQVVALAIAVLGLLGSLIKILFNRDKERTEREHETSNKMIEQARKLGTLEGKFDGITTLAESVMVTVAGFDPTDTKQHIDIKLKEHSDKIEDLSNNQDNHRKEIIDAIEKLKTT